MKFGISLINRGALATPENLIGITRRAEAHGFHCVTISDHIVVPQETTHNYPYHPEGRFPVADAHDYYEPLATLAFLVGATERIRIGTSVLILSYRNPVVTAKVCATADALSGGRVFLGVGTGWWEAEYRALGIPGHFAERGARTDEYMRIFRNLWTEERPEFSGDYYQYSNIDCSPKPAQKGGIPLLVGGHTRRALRRTAELGDGWHPIGLRAPAGLAPAELRTKRGELDRMCEARGRDPDEVPTVFRCPIRPGADRDGPMTGATDRIVEDIAAYAAAGVQEIVWDVFYPTIAELHDTVDRIAEDIVPAAASGGLSPVSVDR